MYVRPTRRGVFLCLPRRVSRSVSAFQSECVYFVCIPFTPVWGFVPGLSEIVSRDVAVFMSYLHGGDDPVLFSSLAVIISARDTRLLATLAYSE